MRGTQAADQRDWPRHSKESKKGKKVTSKSGKTGGGGFCKVIRNRMKGERCGSWRQDGERRLFRDRVASVEQ